MNVARMPGFRTTSVGTMIMKKVLSWPSTWRTAAETTVMPELPIQALVHGHANLEVLLNFLAVLVLADGLSGLAQLDPGTLRSFGTASLCARGWRLLRWLLGCRLLLSKADLR